MRSPLSDGGRGFEGARGNDRPSDRRVTHRACTGTRARAGDSPVPTGDRAQWPSGLCTIDGIWEGGSFWMLWLCSLRRNTEPPLSSSSLHGDTLGRLRHIDFKFLWSSALQYKRGMGRKENKGPRKKVPLKQSHAALSDKSNMFGAGVQRSLKKSTGVCWSGWGGCRVVDVPPGK